MRVTEEEKRPIMKVEYSQSLQTTTTQVYRRRWIVLAIFSMVSFLPALVWNTWGPVAQAAKEVLNWSDNTIGMLANGGNITYIIVVMPVCWFMDRKGLRVSMLLCTGILLVGTAARCISLEPGVATGTAFLCSVLNGVIMPLTFGGPAMLSATWFPPSERATATGIASFFNYLGISMEFILGPQLVPSPHNVTSMANSTNVTDSPLFSNDGDTWEITNVHELKSGLSHLMYVHCGFAALNFVAVLVYFPAKPPSPPSVSQAVERVEYKKGLVKLIRNRSVWLVVLAYAVPTGVLAAWGSVLDVILHPLGITQIQAGWMGFWQTLAGCTAGLIIAKFSDIFTKRMKLYLIILFIGAVASALWFVALCNKYIPENTVSLFASCILIGVFINGTIPLFYEATCEASYPVAEGLTGGFMTLLNNFCGTLFLLILLVPMPEKTWLNWCLLAATAFSLPMLFLFPERYSRTDLDVKQEPDREENHVS